MPEVKWQFRKMSPAEKNQESVEREFFQEENINVRLVREVIQNSLDAALSKEPPPGGAAAGPVRVRFSLAGITEPLPESRAAEYFAGLEPHLRTLDDLDDSIQSRLDSGSLVSGGVPYLVVEDDRTRGLNGDWQQFDDSPDNPAQGNDFYWFFRNTGRSGKGATDNGSWGLGKWVFPDAAHISACLAVTRRSGDDATLLMGMAVLNKHTIDGQRYPPDGYFAELGENELQLPLLSSNPEHAPFIRQCIADFKLRRDTSGLSVVIPFPKVSGEGDAVLDKSQILKAVIHNYFYPIISGQLEVTIEGDGLPVTLNDMSIDGCLTTLDSSDSGERSPDSYRKLFAMYRQIRGRSADDFIDLSAPPVNSPSYPHYDYLAACRADYEAGKLLAFRVATTVRRKNDADRQDTAFRLYVQKDNALTAGHDYYVRGTLSIPGMDYIGRYPARALLIVNEGEPLAAMLRDSEPPTHSLWRPQVDNVAKRWVAPRDRIDEVRRAPVNMLRILEAPPEGLQRDALADIFSWDGKWGQDKPQPAPIPPGPGPHPGPGPKPPEIHLPPARDDFAISRISGGFRVTWTEGSGSTGPARARLRAAYVTPQGNPLSKYHEQDFRLHGEAALPVTITGGKVEDGDGNRPGNELLLSIDDPAQFTLTVRGFDRSRDVHIKMERLPAPSGEG